MRAGDLRHNIDIQSYTSTTGDRGQARLTWNTIATVRAMIEPLTGRKLELARQLVANSDTKITIRYLPALTVECRLVFGSRIFNIGNISNLQEQNFTQEILAIEQVTGL